MITSKISKFCIASAVAAVFCAGVAFADVNVNTAAKHNLNTDAFKTNVLKRLNSMNKGGNPAFTKDSVEIAESKAFSLNDMNLVAVKMVLKAPNGAGQQIVKLVTNADGSMQFDSVSDITTGNELSASFLENAYAPELPKDYADVVFTGEGKREVVMVSDPFCPYCRKAWTELVKPNRGNIGSMKLGHLPLPMHPGAEVACTMMLAAKEIGASVEEVVDFAYGDLTSPDQGVSGQAAQAHVFDQFAKKFPKVKDVFGEGASGLEKLMKSEFTNKLNKEMMAAQEMDINGTPAFFIDGKMLKGFNTQSFNDMLKK